MQPTGVEPTEKLEPLAGVHAIVTGGAPPDAVGVANWTGIADPLVDVIGDGEAGHEMCGPSGKGSTGGLGFEGLLQLAAPNPAPSSSNIRRRDAAPRTT